VALTDAQLEEAALWLEAHALAAEQIRAAAEAQAAAAWAGIEDWYDALAVAAVAAVVAQASLSAQSLVVGSAQAFIANVVAILRDTMPVVPATGRIGPIRNGAPLPLVHSRPAEVYRKAVATGHPEPEAVELAQQRAEAAINMDVLLANREAQQSTLRLLRIERFRRVVRPELSEGGSCGLCIVASDRIYYTSELMPLHDRCKCETMPIVGDVDPGVSLNEVDLGRFYDEAGSTAAADLKKTRDTVNEHGEYGPVLTKAGDAFRDQSRVALEDDPKRAARLLAKAVPVLVTMETSSATRPQVLAYQREFVGRLRSIVGRAA
jgi:hypothetical protein